MKTVAGTFSFVGTSFFTAPLKNASGGYDHLFVYIDAPSADSSSALQTIALDQIDQTISASDGTGTKINWHWQVTIDALADGLPIVQGPKVLPGN